MSRLHQRLLKKPRKLCQQSRYLLDKTGEFFWKGNILALDMWGQSVFVAMEQASQENKSNDIHQYGNVTWRSVTQPTIT